MGDPRQPDLFEQLELLKKLQETLEIKIASDFIEARVADSGFYQTQIGGHVVWIPPPSRVSRLWPSRPGKDSMPYKIEGNPTSSNSLHRETVRGWLPGGYKIRKTTQPEWWKAKSAQKAAGLEKFRQDSSQEEE